MPPSRLARQIEVVVEAAGLERLRLLKWITAYANLSAVWFFGDGEWEPARTPLAVAGLAAAELAAAELAVAGRTAETGSYAPAPGGWGPQSISDMRCLLKVARCVKRLHIRK